MNSAGNEVVVEQWPTALELKLNRARANNALTIGMIRTIARALERYSDHSDILRVVIRSEATGVFCAGGDIKAIRTLVLGGAVEEAMQFFREEFAVNLALSQYPLDTIALVDGLCFGGGCGLSLHGPLCVVTENALFAMPETLIGYIPDVGASHFLSRLPNGLGHYLALSGARFGAGDACALGLATHFVPSEHLADLRAALLVENCGTESIIERFARPVEPGPLWTARYEIAEVFEKRNVDELLKPADGLPNAGPWQSQLARNSPNSLHEASALLDRAKGRSLLECLDDELVTARRVISHPDFSEGVRALLVDKDNAPRWRSCLG